jgi:N-acetylglucosamine kinase-like BadF-type ATPase
MERQKASQNLHSVLHRACEAARVQSRDIRHVCIGMAGASLPEAVQWAQETIRELTPAASIYVAGDHIIAHRAAFGTSHGVLTIAGTGSIAFGRNPSGQTARAGGWGPNVSDEGSAFWVGRQAVIEALRAYDLGSSTGLLPLIAGVWKVAPEEVVRLANASEPQFAELAAHVTAAAESGDQTAKAITSRAGEELSWLAGAVIHRLWPQGGVVPVALAGGVLQGSAPVRQAFKEAMRAKHRDAAVSFAYVRPVLGALEIAAQQGRN